MKSLRKFEQDVLASLAIYYQARRASMRHPTSTGLLNRAAIARRNAFKDLNSLKAVETKRGVKL